MEELDVRLSVARIGELAQALGLATPMALSQAADIHYQTARRFLADDPTLTTFHGDTIIRIARALNVTDVGSLFSLKETGREPA